MQRCRYIAVPLMALITSCCCGQEPKSPKEIGELQAKVRKLAAEYAVARLIAPGADGFGNVGDAIGVEGQAFPTTGDSLDILKEFLVAVGVRGTPVRVSLRDDTQVFFSDKRKAKLSDLRAGQLMSIGGKIALATNPPRIGADAIFIEKAARDILDRKEAATIAKQVDFDTEYLLLCRWQGWTGFATDQFFFKVREEKDGPEVVFSFTRPVRRPGMAKVGMVQNERLFAIAKNARIPPVTKKPVDPPGKPVEVTIIGFPPREIGEVTKITSVEELKKAFPDAK